MKKCEIWKNYVHKIIIIATVILLIVSFSVLFVIEAKNHNYDYNKAWSVAYFENPRDNSLDFAIENHEGAKCRIRLQNFYQCRQSDRRKS